LENCPSAWKGNHKEPLKRKQQVILKSETCIIFFRSLSIYSFVFYANLLSFWK
jgi:hypothetical protein